MTTFLRISDTIIALFWLWALFRSLAARRIGGRGGFRSGSSERPGQYWSLIFVFALMVLHFGGLAIVGQRF